MLTNRFETILADTVESRKIHFELRYRVFCEETGFEDATRFPDQQERDEFDCQSVHFIIWDRVDKQWVGAMRLVDASNSKLPCELIGGEAPDGLESNRKRSREFSRLCILPQYRQTPESMFFGFATPDHNPDGQPFPTFYRQEDHEILLRLVRATLNWSKLNSVDYCYFIVTPALARIFKRFGIPLIVAGHPVQHRGSRIPHRYAVHEAETGMMGKLPSFARLAGNSRAFVPYSEFINNRTKAKNPPALESPRVTGATRLSRERSGAGLAEISICDGISRV